MYKIRSSNIFIITSFSLMSGCAGLACELRSDSSLTGENSYENCVNRVSKHIQENEKEKERKERNLLDKQLSESLKKYNVR